MPRKPDMPCAGCGKLIWRSRTSRPEGEATCRECLGWRPARHGRPKCPGCGYARCQCEVQRWTCLNCGEACERRRARGKRPKFCSPECARFAYGLTCGWCGREFRADRRSVRTCSPSCAQYLRYYTPSRSRELVHVPHERPRPEMRHPTRTWAVIVQGDCHWCGEAFTALTPHGVSRFCSDRCMARSGECRRGRFKVSPLRRRRLYERDGWTCRICDQPTSREFVQGDPWAPTLDHIEPQAAALIPDHSDGNLRTAHLLCNSLRGDGRLTDDEVRGALTMRREVIAHGFQPASTARS